MTKNCLVFGGNGLIGSQIAEQLSKRNHSVKAFDLFKGKDNLQGIRVGRIEADFLDKEAVRAALEGVDLVFHCIHSTFPKSSVKRPLFDAETNILPTIALLKQAAKSGVEKIVYISTLAVYGNPVSVPIKETAELNPLSPYGISKMAIEKYIEFFGREHGLDYAILRPATTYGEKQQVSQETGVMANFVSSALNKKPITIYQKDAVRDILHVEDLARGAIEAALKKTEDKIFNLGAGQGISLTNLLEKISQITKTEPEVKFLEGKGVKSLVCDISRAEKQLGWRPSVSLDEGIKRLFNAWKGAKDA